MVLFNGNKNLRLFQILMRMTGQKGKHDEEERGTFNKQEKK
jgi:hypothetical protein